MGIYLNPDKDSFEEAVNSDIFIDKTEMIRYLNSVIRTKQKYISVSRPRRFGKTMAADMICAYYSREADSRELFSKRKIAETSPVRTGENEIAWDGFLEKFDVIRLVMTDFMDDSDSVQGILDYMTEEVVEELREAFPDVNFGSRITLRNVLNKIYGKTGHQFVIVIDEWDAIFRTWKEDNNGQKKYLDFLRNLLKDRPYIALAYMTGILPIKKYGRHSALNMFDEYSMMNPMQLAPYTGFITEEALELTRQYGRDFASIKDWYNGYNVSDIVPPDPDHCSQKETGKAPEAKRYDLYCPLSVVNAVRTGKIQNYWNKTETYEALAEYKGISCSAYEWRKASC